MTTISPIDTRHSTTRRYFSAADWVRDLGDVPLARIVMDPPPGTATELDQVRMVEGEHRFVELIDGTLVEKPMGSYESMLSLDIALALKIFLADKEWGAVTGEAAMMRMSNGRVRMPDVGYTSYDRLPNGEPPREPVWPVCPDLCIEVLSESNTKGEIDQKLKEFFASGARLAWIFDPEKNTVVVYRSSGQPDQVLHMGEALDGGEVLPGFSMPLTAVFKPHGKHPK